MLESEVEEGEEETDNTTDGESSSIINKENEVELGELRDDNMNTTPKKK